MCKDSNPLGLQPSASILQNGYSTASGLPTSSSASPENNSSICFNKFYKMIQGLSPLKSTPTILHKQSSSKLLYRGFNNAAPKMSLMACTVGSLQAALIGHQEVFKYSLVHCYKWPSRCFKDIYKTATQVASKVYFSNELQDAFNEFSSSA